jgi:hypothetical protein
MAAGKDLKTKGNIHHRGAEFAEKGVFFMKKYFTQRPPRLSGDF